MKCVPSSCSWSQISRTPTSSSFLTIRRPTTPSQRPRMKSGSAGLLVTLSSTRLPPRRKLQPTLSTSRAASRFLATPAPKVPWQSVHTAEQVLARLAGSRRMRLAMLEAWPDPPNLDLTYTAREGAPPRNAIAQFIGGLSHDDSHLDQIRRIVIEAREARATV